jgi:hypothetical protein
MDRPGVAAGGGNGEITGKGVDFRPPLKRGGAVGVSEIGQDVGVDGRTPHGQNRSECDSGFHVASFSVETSILAVYGFRCPCDPPTH